MSDADQVTWIFFVHVRLVPERSRVYDRVCVCKCMCVCVNSEWHKELVIWEDPHDNTFTIVLWYPGVAQDPIYLPYAVT